MGVRSWGEIMGRRDNGNERGDRKQRPWERDNGGERETMGERQ